MELIDKLKQDAQMKMQLQTSTSAALPSSINDNKSISKTMANSNSQELNDTVQLLDNMLEEIVEVDFLSTFMEKLNDPLLKYESDEGSIDLKRIPRALYAVAIMKELKDIGENNGWDFAQQDGMLYVYNRKYWEKLEDGVIKAFLSNATIRMGYFSPAEAESNSFIDMVFKQFILSSFFPNIESKTDAVLINLQNGTYEITEHGGRLREHHKSDFLTYSLPFAYKADAKAPLFTRYLNRVLPDASSQLVLQEFIGYIFIKNLKLEKALILYGSGQNGKSVMFEIITALLGEVNVSTKSLGDIVDRDSGNDNRAKLKDKLVNYGSEISSRAMDIDMFKRLVSGEPVAAREKYKTSFDLKNNCKFIFNANKLPANIEHTEAYFRRFIILPFTVMIHNSEKDPELHTKITLSELPGVLSWAIVGLNRLLTNKEFTECEAAHIALEEYKKESSSVAMMIEDEGLIDGHSVEQEYRMPNKKLYPRYREYCSENGMHALNNINFSKELRSLGFKPYRVGNERGFIIKQVS